MSTIGKGEYRSEELIEEYMKVLRTDVATTEKWLSIITEIEKIRRKVKFNLYLLIIYSKAFMVRLSEV